jgi:hypothetical protein
VEPQRDLAVAEQVRDGPVRRHPNWSSQRSGAGPGASRSSSRALRQVDRSASPAGSAWSPQGRPQRCTRLAEVPGQFARAFLRAGARRSPSLSR